jgi:DNA-binding MarR family transcriptional regulator
MMRDEQLAASLWIRLAKCYGLVLREVRSRGANDLTLPQFDALAQLLRHEGGMTAGALSRALLVTAGNVTGIVDRLEARGLVSRRTLPEDRRTVLLTLTPVGRRLATREVRRHERLLGRVFRGVPRDDQERLRAALDELRAALESQERRAPWPSSHDRSSTSTTQRRASPPSPSSARSG